MHLPRSCTPVAAGDITGRKMADDEPRGSWDFPGQIRWADFHAECDYFAREWSAFTGRISEQGMMQDEGTLHTIIVKPGNRNRGEKTGESHG